MRTVQELRAIAAAGGGFTVGANDFGVQDLRAIAAASGGRARITIANANQLSADDLRAIAAAGSGSITFTEI